jgi:hypothetical protein
LLLLAERLTTMPSNHISDGLPQPPVGVTRDDTPLPLYVGDANDPATVLADADAFYAMWFGGSDDDEVAIINAAFNQFAVWFPRLSYRAIKSRPTSRMRAACSRFIVMSSHLLAGQ